MSTATAYYTMLSYAPLHPEVHGKTIHAANKVFAIGAENPTTYCGLDDPKSCPSSNATLVDAEMTRLAVSIALPSNIQAQWLKWYHSQQSPAASSST